MRIKIFLIFIFTFVTINQLSAQERSIKDTNGKVKYTNNWKNYSLVGRVYGEEVRQVPPYDVLISPLIKSNLTIKELLGQGWLTDSTGCFRIDGLKKGNYHLKAEFVGLHPCDTLISLPKRVDTLRFVLPLWYEHMYEYSTDIAQKNIQEGHPYLVMVYPANEWKKLYKNPFWKKYGVSYRSYDTEKGKLLPYLGIPNNILTSFNNEVFNYFDKKYGKDWQKEAPKGIFGMDKTLNEPLDYAWLIKVLSKSSKYPARLLEQNKGSILRVEYEVDSNGYVTNPRIVSCSDRKFKKVTLNAFKTVQNMPTRLKTGKDTLLFQYKLDLSAHPIHPHADVLIIGYSSCDVPILMRYERLLIARTNEKFLEAGVSVCYLNERGDTIIPYGKYRFCQTDTIKAIGFVYENKQGGKIVCIDVNGNKLFNVFKYDSGPDYVREVLFRITDDNGLIGFADTLGNVIIKFRFKFAFPFENEVAKVTDIGEERDVPGSNGEKHYWNSSDRYYINRNGENAQIK